MSGACVERAMGSLAQLPELVGFFSYSRRDDKDFRGSLFALRAEIQRELSALLAHRNFRLWQDQDAIDPGDLWESKIKSAIEQSVFFIPIVTPRAITSRHCKFEFESFLARERALGRNDLVFPIHYISVYGLLDEAERGGDPVLSIVAERQYADWRGYRRKPVDAPDFGQEIEAFCGKIVKKLRAPWVSPDECRRLEAEAKKRAEDEERERLRKEAIAKRDAAPLTAAEERALKPGDSFKEGEACPAMIVVPAGLFLMGSPASQGYDSERPQHEVNIARPFAVAKFALTFDEWDTCAAQGGCRRDVSDEGWGRGRRPVINVSWNDARAYVRWLSRITGKRYRLLSEAEYEYAARAGAQTAYPWGDDIKLNGKALANCRGCGSQWDGKQTAPVGSFPANAFGPYDMVGNVAEWTEDRWNDTYQGAPADGSARTNGRRNTRVFRGGSWDHVSHSLRSADKNSSTTDSHSYVLGFRVARTLTP
jgi:formylglycine-generating enzyme required for sulfatase activity